MTALQPRSTAHAALATDGEGAERASDTASSDSVAGLWRLAWEQLGIAFPNIEQRLAQLERERPTRFRALARLEASAGRWAGRCLRGEALPLALLKKLWTWQLAVVTELEKTT